MTEHLILADQIATQQIRERVASAKRGRPAQRRRRSGRHTVASSLHGLANRLDA